MSGPPAEVTESLDTSSYDDIIDVRSPAEFAADHLPGAINLPVLTDAERAHVGTVYKQDSAFKARKIGAALVSRNIAGHIEDHFAAKSGDYKPLIYCWRGGQRSASLATVLSQIGWQVTLLKGGYKHYRSWVIERLYHGQPWFEVRILAGLTGTAKTRLLHALGERGSVVIDLEGLAHHRGSLLGADPHCPQPSQKAFESALLLALQAIPQGQSIWVEAESSKIGEIYIPPLLWKSMAQAPAMEICAPLGARVDFLCKEYAHFFSDSGGLSDLLDKLVPLHGHERIEGWKTQIGNKNWQALVSSLLTDHYDPAYRRSMRKNRRTAGGRFELADLGEAALADCAERIAGVKAAA